MTSHSENELLTRVGPGTAMGDLMRQVPGYRRVCRRNLSPMTIRYG